MALEENIKELEAELKRLKTIKAAVEKVYDCHLDEFPFPDRFLKVIKNLKPHNGWEPMFTIRELVSLTELDIRMMPGIGEHTRKEVDYVLHSLGLWWGMVKNTGKKKWYEA